MLLAEADMWEAKQETKKGETVREAASSGATPRVGPFWGGPSVASVDGGEPESGDGPSRAGRR